MTDSWERVRGSTRTRTHTRHKHKPEYMFVPEESQTEFVKCNETKGKDSSTDQSARDNFISLMQETKRENTPQIKEKQQEEKNRIRKNTNMVLELIQRCEEEAYTFEDLKFKKVNNSWEYLQIEAKPIVKPTKPQPTFNSWVQVLRNCGWVKDYSYTTKSGQKYTMMMKGSFINEELAGILYQRYNMTSEPYPNYIGRVFGKIPTIELVTKRGLKQLQTHYDTQNGHNDNFIPRGKFHLSNGKFESFIVLDGIKGGMVEKETILGRKQPFLQTTIESE